MKSYGWFVLTGGLLAIMPLLLIITLAVSIERLWFLKRILRQGRDIHSRLRQVPYQNIAGLQMLADQSGETLQGHLISTAIASRGESAEEMESHLEEEVLDALPKINRWLWILDTSVTIAPLLGLFGTIIGMIQAFNVLSANGGPSKVTGGIADALISTGCRPANCDYRRLLRELFQFAFAADPAPARTDQTDPDQPRPWQGPERRQPRLRSIPQQRRRDRRKAADPGRSINHAQTP